MSGVAKARSHCSRAATFQAVSSGVTTGGTGHPAARPQRARPLSRGQRSRRRASPWPRPSAKSIECGDRSPSTPPRRPELDASRDRIPRGVYLLAGARRNRRHQLARRARVTARRRHAQGLWWESVRRAHIRNLRQQRDPRAANRSRSFQLTKAIGVLVPTLRQLAMTTTVRPLQLNTEGGWGCTVLSHSRQGGDGKINAREFLKGQGRLNGRVFLRR